MESSSELSGLMQIPFSMMELVPKALKKFPFVLFVLLVKVSSFKEKESRNDK